MDQVTAMVLAGLVVVATVIIVTSRIGAGLVAGWRVVATIMKTVVQVPWGISLIVIGATIAWQLSDLIGCAIAGVFLYFGGNSLFGAIETLNKIWRPSNLDRYDTTR